MARVFLSNETYNAATSGAQVFGAAGTEQVNIFSGTTGVSVASSVERVDLSGNIADYTFSSFGAAMTIRDTAGNIVATVSDSGGKSVVFADGALSAAYAGTTLSLGGVDLTGTAAAITPAAADIDATTTSDAAGSTTGGTTGGAAQSFTLTAGADVFSGGAGNDTFTAAVGTLQTGDALLDGSSTDNDTLNAVLAADNQAPTISGIENITIDLDVFAGASASVDASNISGGTITLFSDKLGFNGVAEVDNAGSVNVTAGSNITSLDLDGYEGGVVTAGSADTVTITPNAATDNVSLSVSGDVTAAIDAASNNWAISSTAASNVAITGSTAPTGTITASGSANLILSDVGTLLSGVSIVDSMSSGTLTVDVDTTGNDGSDWAVDNVNVSASIAALTVRNSQLVTLEVTQAALTITGQNGSTGTATVTTAEDQTSLTTATLNELTVNVTDDVAIATLTATGDDVVVTGTGDVTIGGTAADVASINASALTGDFTFTETAGAGNDIVATGSATGENTIVFVTDAGDTTYTGGAGIDTVTMAQTTGDSTVSLGDGANQYTNSTVTTGTATVTGGSGVDDITIITAGDATVEVVSGGGDDVVSLQLGGAGVDTAVFQLGDGNDTVTLVNGTIGADIIVIDGGAGTDVLDLAGKDISSADVTVANIIVRDSDGNSKVDGSMLTGESVTIQGDGAAATLLDVVIGTAGTYDFSSLVIDATLANGIGGLAIAPAATTAVTVKATSGNDTFTATDVSSFEGGAGNDLYTGFATKVNTAVINDGDTSVTGVATAANATAAALLTDTLVTWTDAEDLIDISGLTGITADTAVNDQTGAAIAHVATDLGDVLVVQATTAADAIVYVNTTGGTTASFADFEAAIYITGGAAATYTVDDFVFV